MLSHGDIELGVHREQGDLTEDSVSPRCPCSWKPVADYIDQQFEQYFRDESGLNRKNIQDNRVHCCIYFISPFGHGYGRPCAQPGHRGSVGLGSPGSPRRLRPLDVEFMRALHQRVNIVPVLAKADTLTPAEVERMKNKVRGGGTDPAPRRSLGRELPWYLHPSPVWNLPWSVF